MKELVKFKDILDQDKSIYLLKSLIAKNKIHKTLLFSGIKGIGKKTTAFAFAAACNCQSVLQIKKDNSQKQRYEIDACGICSSCKLITAGHHPDILHLNFQKNIITVSQIRSLLNTASMKPYNAQNKIIIITQAQNMNIEASNAFLKFLEEPHNRTVIILISTNQSNLIPTVLSRCQHVRFNPLKLETIKQLILKSKSKSKFTATAAKLSRGSLAKAKQFSNTDYNNKRKWLISTVNSIYCNKKTNSIDIQELMLFSEQLSKHQNTIDDSLTIIQLWLRDILIYKLSPNKIFNIDMQEEIDRISKIMHFKTILDLISAIQEAQVNLTSSTNLRLVLDTMLISMAEINLP